MKLVSNGCRYGKISVYPKTWERTNASIKKQWYINYRFFDPAYKDKYPIGYQKRIKGMNSYHTLVERQDAVRTLLKNEIEILDAGYNPILEQFTHVPDTSDYIISPYARTKDALDDAFKRVKMCPEGKMDVKSTLKYFQIAAAELNLDYMAVKDIRRRHIIKVMDRLAQTKDIWTAATHNRYLKNMRAIFKELLKVEAIEGNPVNDIDNLKKTETVKEVLTVEEIRLIQKLRGLNYTFWRIIQIFCNSGARTTELMKVKISDVDLERQMVKYTILKDKVIRTVERPIKTEVLYLWKELMIEAKGIDGDCYVFSRGLKPGLEHIRKDQVKRRWILWVQERLGISKTWYSLKYLNTDAMDALYGSDIAAQLNSHNKAMVEKHYAVGRTNRRNEVLKAAPNPLTIEHSADAAA